MSFKLEKQSETIEVKSILLMTTFCGSYSIERRESDYGVKCNDVTVIWQSNDINKWQNDDMHLLKK